uniref:Uncharacterized protein n=1 Tax=Oryza meridionalis TaxID=40149 RepID=A0A0E0D1S8_9ORYZ
MATARRDQIMPSNIPKKYQEIDHANHHLQTSPHIASGFRGMRPPTRRTTEIERADDRGGPATAGRTEATREILRRADLPSRTHLLSVLYRPPRPCRSEAAGAGRRFGACRRAFVVGGGATRPRAALPGGCPTAGGRISGGIEIPRRESGERRRRRATNLEERGRSFRFYFDSFVG